MTRKCRDRQPLPGVGTHLRYRLSSGIVGCGLALDTPTFLADLRDLVGPRNLLTDPDLTIGHRIDWTGRFTADPVPVVRPGSAGEIAELVTLARRDGIALVPQGGNTGLVGGATPMEGGVVVDMRRLGQVSDLDPVAGQLTAGAGATIGEVQAVARGVGWEYGVDWAARDSATVGGSIATDAGGIRFVAHEVRGVS